MTTVPQTSSTVYPNVSLLVDERFDPIKIPGSAATWEGFREWARSDDFPERGKITYVAGELIVDMSPESYEKHSEIKSEVSRVLLNLVRDNDLGRLHIDGALISNKAACVSNEPDILFLSKKTLKSGQLEFVAAKGDPDSSKEAVGTVDWVLEIVSPSSKRKDQVLLRKAYFDSGIGEYWLVNALGEEIEFEILIPGKVEYQAVQPQDGWLASPTFSKEFKLERDRDNDGFVRYTLHMR